MTQRRRPDHTLGVVLRRSRSTSCPQLVNVLRGQMSLVGPRPDVPGFADVLTGDDRLVLSVRPGITGPATLAYRHEEELLASVRILRPTTVRCIWPDKVRINCDYVGLVLASDLACLFATCARMSARRSEPMPRRSLP